MNYTANLQITFGIVEERAIFFQMISQKNEDAMIKKNCCCLLMFMEIGNFASKSK